MPWHRIYTTNIDNIGLNFSNRRCLDAATETKPSNKGDFVYLHGCLANCQPNNYYTKVKMGEQLYMAGSHSTSPYHSLLQQDLHESDCVFVVGYSMGDPDLARIFFGAPSLLNKCFVFSGNTGALDHHRITLIGTDTKQTSTDFLAAVDAIADDPSPSYSAQIEVDHGGFDLKPVSQIARQNLLIYGRYDRNIARSSWSDPDAPIYCVSRSISERIANVAAPATIVVHSHLGNGKTIILEEAKFAIAQRKETSFTLDSTADLEQLRGLLEELPSGSRAFFEGDIFLVSRVQDVLAAKNLVLCATSRTTTMRVAARELYSKAKTSIRAFDANRLDEEDLLDFHDLIETMGFWPPRLQQRSDEQRFTALRDEYESSICAIVLSIFENAVIREQIGKIWDSTNPTLRAHMDHFVVASYMDLIDVDIPPFLIQQFQSFDFRIGKALENELVSVDASGILSFSNSIVGEFIFKTFLDKEAIIGAVVRFANFINGHYAQRRYQWAVRRLLRYWNLSRILDSKTLPEEVFDRASYIPSISADPLFWVQYSIAKMENGEFLPARRFVDTAYGKAKEIGDHFDTYQIDTHAARLTVRNLIDNGLYDGFATDLNRAVQTLRGVAERRPDDVYHVSTVVTLLLNSKVHFQYEMTEREYGIFRNSLIAIGDRIDELAKGGDYSFVPERQASDLINVLR